MSRTTRMITVATSALLLSAVSLSGFAASNFDKTHPRRAEVNARLKNQNHRIDREVKEGELTRTQAVALHKEDRQIRGEERAMASQNGGHITKTEQKTLNQQENKVSQQIGK